MSKPKNNTPKEILNLIKSSGTILVNMDSRFDYDSLCSALTLHKVLTTEFKKDVKVIYSGDLSQKEDLFFDTSFIIDSTDISTYDLTSIDLVITVDSGSANHYSSKDFTLPKSSKHLNIDHHKSNDYYGVFNYVKHYASTCSVIYELLEAWETSIDTDVCNFIALGLLVDSGFFSYDTITAFDYRLAAKLTELGVVFNDYTVKLSFNLHLDTYKIQKIVLENLVVNKKKKYAYSFYTTSDLQENNINLDLVPIPEADMIKRLRFTDFVFVVHNLDDTTYKISFRSGNSNTDVSTLAKKFGGGGHIRASGAIVSGFNNVQDVVQHIIDTLDL